MQRYRPWRPAPPGPRDRTRGPRYRRELRTSHKNFHLPANHTTHRMAFRSSSRTNSNGRKARRQVNPGNSWACGLSPRSSQDELGDDGTGRGTGDYGDISGAQVIDQQTGEGTDPGTDDGDHETFGHSIPLSRKGGENAKMASWRCFAGLRICTGLRIYA